jgi:hypothetical protein
MKDACQYCGQSKQEETIHEFTSNDIRQSNFEIPIPGHVCFFVHEEGSVSVIDEFDGQTVYIKDIDNLEVALKRAQAWLNCKRRCKSCE